MGGIGTWQLLILLLVVVLVFGTKRMRSMGSDLGGALKGFRKGIQEEDDPEKLTTEESTSAEIHEEKEPVSKPTDPAQ
jgi:sec-independent protein translocase protein TatA